MNFVAQAATRDFMEHYQTSTPHAVLLSGLRGVGLRTMALQMAEAGGTLLEVIEPESKTPTGPKSITVERIRDLYLTTRSLMSKPHFIVIDDAETMHPAAQNALLKLLEEPNESIYFILTSHAPDTLLPTIRSRTQHFTVPPLDNVLTSRLLKSLGVADGTKQHQLRYIADGLPAELTRLASDESSFRRLSESVTMTRRFLEGNTYGRMAVIQTLKDDRNGAIIFIDTTLLVLRRSFTVKPLRETTQLIDRLLDTRMRILAGGNVRLQLMSAVV